MNRWAIFVVVLNVTLVIGSWAQAPREAGLSKCRLQVEAEMLTQGPGHVDGERLKAHATDLKAVLEEGDVARSKGFLRTFIKRIEITGDGAIVK